MPRPLPLVLLLLAACGDPVSPVPPPAARTSPTDAPPAGRGTVRGVVRVKGDDLAAITRRVVGMEHSCGTETFDLGVWRVDASTRALADAVVWVEGVDRGRSRGATPVVDNRACLFHPPVTLMAPGDLKVTNSDSIPHSFDLRSSLNPRDNHLLPAEGSKLVALRIPERITVGCSVHPWMHAVVVVTSNPTAALSAADGSFVLTDVPAGRRRVRLWHRCVGDVDAGEVEIPVGDVARLDIEVDPRLGFRSDF